MNCEFFFFIYVDLQTKTCVYYSTVKGHPSQLLDSQFGLTLLRTQSLNAIKPIPTVVTVIPIQTYANSVDVPNFKGSMLPVSKHPWWPKCDIPQFLFISPPTSGMGGASAHIDRI